MKMEELKFKVFFMKEMLINLGMVFFNCIVKMFMFVYSSLKLLKRFYVYY